MFTNANVNKKDIRAFESNKEKSKELVNFRDYSVHKCTPQELDFLIRWVIIILQRKWH